LKLKAYFWNFKSYKKTCRNCEQ